MKDLIFVVKNDGTYEQVPNRNLRAQENYSDNFVVISNQYGSVKAKIRLLSRTDKVEVKYLVPSLESVESFIGDKPYFQEYANANIWRGAVPKKLLQEISMSYSGQVEVAFSFLKIVDDPRATTYKGDIYEGDSLYPSGEDGFYYVIKMSSYTYNETTWTFGQTAIYQDGNWVKGGSYRVLGTTTTHRLNVEPTLIGEQTDEDIEEADEIVQALGELVGEIANVDNKVTNVDDKYYDEIHDIKSGNTVVGAAEKDSFERIIEETYISAIDEFKATPNATSVNLDLKLKTPTGVVTQKQFALQTATQSLAGILTASDKTRLDNLWAILQDSDDPNFVDTISEILAIFANYPEGMDIVTEFSKKADKTTVASDLAQKADASNKAAILGVLTPNDIINGSTEPKLVTGKEMRDFGVELITEYGIRYIEGQASPTAERVKRVNGELFVGSATNLVANVGIDAQIVENSFDDIDIFRTERVLVNGNYLVKRKLYFHKVEWKIEGGVTYKYLWMCAVKLAGYIRPRIFFDDNGEEIDFAYLGAFEASEVGGIARSIPNAFPRVAINRNNARIAARKNDGSGTNTDSRWGIKDLAEYHYHIVIPFQVEFATRHSQSIMQGAVSMPFLDTHVALVAETGNTFVLTNTFGAAYVVGQTIGIGATRYGSQIASNRIVTNIEVDTPVAGQTTITFDGEPAVVTEGSVIATRGWKTGSTNGVKASSGSLTANNGQYPFVFRGYENPYGNIWKFVDGGKISNHQLWVAEDRSLYNDTSSVGGLYATPFNPVSYVTAKNDGYVKELGFDAMFPYACLPIVAGGVGAGASAYYSDYYYQTDAGGDRTLLVGGNWTSGSYDGLFAWYCAGSLTTSDLNFGFRLSYRPLKGVH